MILCFGDGWMVTKTLKQIDDEYALHVGKRFVCGRTDETEASPRRTGTPIIRTAGSLASNHSLGFSGLSRLSAASQNMVISLVVGKRTKPSQSVLRNDYGISNHSHRSKASSKPTPTKAPICKTKEKKHRK